ncbi:DUF4383 domain-containing protein [Streptacidiphilus sp. PB12-B1b]|uniref:DUF4383 domain-containing protein n=1 Tax=Streptacidiphilus sp. PB12-B1b TaxID=2705012 RepID=UPI0015F8CE7A|nr:DUF4383 domain-containing protein [Streptacidiphilus sp. PB12-B1b]QMU77139.1 DUF4383 domain-containing protein [Streptacidiphilus sp. PB12-B1b]
MDLRNDLPVDHRLATVYRYGAGLSGLALLCFGALGFAQQLSFFGTNGTRIAGLSSNGALSLISVVFGLVLIVGAVIGGNIASAINMAVGTLFILSGFVNLGLLERSANVLGFRMPNVLFSFLMGLIILTFGMYGRVSGGLPADNPYWRRRHPEAARRLAELGASRPRPTTAAFAVTSRPGTSPRNPS